jgi:hypothetical protein
VDGYFPVLEQFGDRLESLEDEAMNNPSRDSLVRIHDVRNDLMTLRRALWPTRDVLHALGREQTPFVGDHARTHFRDCYDHTMELLDLMESYREIGARSREVSSPGPPAQPSSPLRRSPSSPQALRAPSPHPHQASTPAKAAHGPQPEVWGASELHRRVDSRLRLMRWLMGAGLDEPEIQASSGELERARVSSVDELHGRWTAVAPLLPPRARSKLGARLDLATWLRHALLREARAAAAAGLEQRWGSAEEGEEALAVRIDEALALLSSLGEVRSLEHLRASWANLEGEVRARSLVLAECIRDGLHPRSPPPPRASASAPPG